MAGLRVFVSSTCYDLAIVRTQLRAFLHDLGHEPVMSEYNDILYDHRTHTHTSCIDEVANADFIILIIGSRFGGFGIEEAIERINFESLMENERESVENLKENSENKFSITQLEILKAIESRIPVYTFIESAVLNDHQVYSRNKTINKEILDQIIFPSIEKHKHTKYIFGFIDFLKHRSIGNSIFPFTKIQDIEDTFKKQLSMAFQRLLIEDRKRVNHAKQIDDLTIQFENLKTAILTTITDQDQKEVANGVIKYRGFIARCYALLRDKKELKKILMSDKEYAELIELLNIEKIISSNSLKSINPNSEEILHKLEIDTDIRPNSQIIIMKDKDYFYTTMRDFDIMRRLEENWNDFKTLKDGSKKIIIETLLDNNENTFISTGIRRINYPFEKIFSTQDPRQESLEYLKKLKEILK